MRRVLPTLLVLFTLLLSVFNIPFSAQAAAVRGSVHGLSSSQLRSLRQLPARAILPSQLPAGYVLKQIQVQAGPEPSYQLDYRCFCSGLNYTITLLGTTQPRQAGKAKGQLETLSAPRLKNKLQLGLYPAGQGYAQDYYMSSWLSSPKSTFKMGVISALQGHRAPKADLQMFIKGLEYLP